MKGAMRNASFKELTSIVAVMLATSLGASAADAEGPSKTTAISTEYIATMYAPLNAPQAANSNLLIFHPKDGGWFDGAIKAQLMNPAGDWVRVMPNGSMRIDVRLTAKLDDGELLYVTYGGVLRKPDAASWERFMKGEKISAPSWYYVITTVFETVSKSYAWLNDVQAIGKFVSIQSGAQAHVRFDIYAVR